MKLALLNFFWAIFTFLGFVVFGLFPSTVAMFTVLRRMVQSQDETFNSYGVFQEFFQTWKKEFFTSNRFGLIFISVGWLLWFNASLILLFEGIPLTIMLTAMIGTSVFFIVALLFWFPVYVQFQLSWTNYLKVALLLPFTDFRTSLISIFGAISFGMIVYSFPVFAIFFGISGLGWIIMKASNYSFEKMKVRHA